MRRGNRRRRHRRLAARRGSMPVEIWVKDEGPGLSSTANLFVPFFTTKPGGSGIGLVLSRQIAEGHGGRLMLENREDRRGCRASLRMPLQMLSGTLSPTSAVGSLGSQLHRRHTPWSNGYLPRTSRRSLSVPRREAAIAGRRTNIHLRRAVVREALPPRAPIVPATCVPWSSSLPALPPSYTSRLFPAKSHPCTSSTYPLPSSSTPLTGANQQVHTLSLDGCRCLVDDADVHRVRTHLVTGPCLCGLAAGTGWRGWSCRRTCPTAVRSRSRCRSRSPCGYQSRGTRRRDRPVSPARRRLTRRRSSERLGHCVIRSSLRLGVDDVPCPATVINPTTAGHPRREPT